MSRMGGSSKWVIEPVGECADKGLTNYFVQVTLAKSQISGRQF